ncbi:hypothetical protein PaG_04302 [Moesziomyces aphidis]|uniref:Uncharacterized protein n=1 Tax=Moesziomyces aphidis TaxID=84754 RepID=W3VL64_MOEAP|nr:hypothetical protein PaG_04302 [Moesziomyces aphidis]
MLPLATIMARPSADELILGRAVLDTVSLNDTGLHAARGDGLSPCFSQAQQQAPQGPSPELEQIKLAQHSGGRKLG